MTEITTKTENVHDFLFSYYSNVIDSGLIEVHWAGRFVGPPAISVPATELFTFIDVALEDENRGC